MRYCEIAAKCRDCDEPTYSADIVPDPDASSGHQDWRYKWVPLCWRHNMERRDVATSRLTEIVHCPQQGLARIDGGRAGGGAVCECGLELRRHPSDIDHPYLTVLCDGSVVKL